MMDSAWVLSQRRMCLSIGMKTSNLNDCVRLYSESGVKRAAWSTKHPTFMQGPEKGRTQRGCDVGSLPGCFRKFFILPVRIADLVYYLFIVISSL